MQILCCIALCAATVAATKLKEKHQETVEDRIGRLEAGMLHMSVRFNSVVKSVARITEHLKIDGNKAAPIHNGTKINKSLLTKQMNNSDLEDRVSVLEMQMVTVLNDIETIEGDQSVQDYRLQEAEGNGYNSGTGVFTVPIGGAGLYYFFAHFAFEHNRGDFASFAIRKNGAILALAFNDDISGSGDTGSSSCGAATVLEEGDWVDVLNAASDDSYPLLNTPSRVNTFSGFRISPE